MKKTVLFMGIGVMVIGSIIGGVALVRQNAAEKREAVPSIIVDDPQPNDLVDTPLRISGKAHGSWFFEASFPVELQDASGAVIAAGTATAQADWMTDGLVPFQSTLDFAVATDTQAMLVFRNDNPSGLAENAKTFQVPVVLHETQTMSVNVFFANQTIDPYVPGCDRLYPVSRVVARTTAVARAAIAELLSGPQEPEKQAGYETLIPSGTSLQRITITDGVARVDFNDALDAGIGGSCRVSAIRAQIERTLEQFPSVQRVIISRNGITDTVLQP